MDYSFNVEIATKYGVPEAIFLQNLYFWITKNEANGRHYYEDKECPGVWRHWTYNSAAALTKLFPFWSKDQIKRLIKKLKDNGLIHVGNYNKEVFDKTGWYALSDEVLRIFRGAISPSPWGDSAPGWGDSAPPIPDSKPDKDLSSSEPPKEKREYPPGCRERKLCDLLVSLMRDNNPNCKIPDDLWKWCDSFRLLIERDNRDPPDIENMIQFTQWDDFWKTNILSPDKLRKQYDQLTLKREEARRKRGG